MYNKKIKLKNRKVVGYRIFIDKEHPLSNSCNYVYYHRHVASLKLGRWIKSHEHVHHLDGNKENNSENNLVILTNKEHSKIHNPDILEKKLCPICKKKFKPSKQDQEYCSTVCGHQSRRKVSRPSKQQLIDDLKNNSFVAVGKKYGVSDNAIRKWLNTVS